ncbi:MAG: right-handed parallel beta-helix repeat-containing protein [Candidatus Thorarchaeota archaeon]
MMNTRMKRLGFVTGLLVILMLGTSVVLLKQQNPSANQDIFEMHAEGLVPQGNFSSSYTPHDSITIYSNNDFSDQGFPGSGTLGEPYVIEGLNITTTGECISIRNTDAYFVIRDCLLTAGFYSDGVIFDYVTHGTIRLNNITGTRFGLYSEYSDYNVIANNTFTENAGGVYLSRSSNNNIVANNTISRSNMAGVWSEYNMNNIIVNNTFSENDVGVYLFAQVSNTIIMNNIISESDIGMFIARSSDSTVVSNIISGSRGGVAIHSSTDVIVDNNTITASSFGLSILSSYDITLYANIFIDGGIRIDGDEMEHWLHTVTPDNLVNEKPLGYFFDLTGGTIDGNQYEQVILVNCTGVFVQASHFDNSTIGIALAFSSYCHVMNNTFSENDWYGFYLCYSSDNMVVDNTFSQNNCAIVLDHSLHNTFGSNIFSENEYSVIFQDSLYNMVTNNTISGNENGVYLDLSLENMIVNNTISENLVAVEFGYGSNNNTVTNNDISGNECGVQFYYGSNNRMMSNIISENIVGVYFYLSQNNTVSGNTITGNTEYGVHIGPYSAGNLIFMNIIADNFENAFDAGTGNQWNITGRGNYWSDYNGTGVFTISGGAGSVDYYPFIYPPETTMPIIDHPFNINCKVGITDNIIIWNPSDEYPSHYVIYQNDILVEIQSWNGSSISVSADGLSAGAYNYTIVVYDTSGNCVSDTVLVIVSEPVSTATTTTTIITTPNRDEIGSVFLFTGIIVIEVVVAVLILNRRRRGS